MELANQILAFFASYKYHFCNTTQHPHCPFSQTIIYCSLFSSPLELVLLHWSIYLWPASPLPPVLPFALSNPLKTDGAQPRILELLPGSWGVTAFPQKPAWLVSLASSWIASRHSGWNLPPVILSCSSAPHSHCSHTLATRVQPSPVDCGKLVLLLRWNIFYTFRISCSRWIASPSCSKLLRFPIAYGIKPKVLMLLFKVLFIGLPYIHLFMYQILVWPVFLIFVFFF